MNEGHHQLSRLGLALVILAAFLAVVVIYVTWVGRFE
jgi:hypothetical protein